MECTKSVTHRLSVWPPKPSIRNGPALHTSLYLKVWRIGFLFPSSNFSFSNFTQLQSGSFKSPNGPDALWKDLSRTFVMFFTKYEFFLSPLINGSWMLKFDLNISFLNQGIFIFTILSFQKKARFGLWPN